jgi:tellurite resistance protein TerC
MVMEESLVSWGIFGTIIISLLILDLGVFNKKDHVISLRESLLMSMFYIAIACGFGAYVFYELGAQSGKEYFTGFILEKAMSLDNIFVISMIFTFFKIPAKYQHRVLFWGILGVIVLRAIMLGLGASLIANFEWVLFIFAAILIYTGVKTFYISQEEPMDVKNMSIYKFLSKKINLYPKLVGNKFFITENSKLYATPLFMALAMVESMDVIFAIDSIPAIFAITQDTYVVYTSNIFAILGLRALFFLLADIVRRFRYIKYSLALILIFIGIKIFVAHFVHIPTYVPLVMTIGLLLLGGFASVLIKEKEM